MRRLMLILTIITGASTLSGSKPNVKMEPEPQDSLIYSLETLIQLIDEANNMHNK